ncbi:MAG TPA: universal stress protein [Gemmatimonadaceae bacterium]|nr:universal stress protein [Gemmatimonadaceae bacterium]
MLASLLVPLDGSAFSAKALPVAAAIAKRTGARLHVVTVLDPSAYVPFVPGEVLVPVMDTEALAARRAADEAAIHGEAERLRADGVQAEGHLLEGTVVEALAEFALTIHADLVVMTTHGRSGLERLWLGSVATSFLQRAPCPVYLVRPEGEASAEPIPTGAMLVPLDGSPFADSMLPRAADFAKSLGLSMRLFTVAIPNAVPMAPFGTEALLADESDLTRQEHDARERLEALARTLPVPCTIAVATDMTATRAIVEEASRDDVGVVAMATHGRTGIARLVLGNVADSVLRSAPRPMLVYRPVAAEVEATEHR